ncbi:MAG: response regulator [Lachnospiraceae bacterium]|nr:response regulator [Lachnospiraceae bacterium]
MEKQVLLIGDTKSFMVNAIVNGLKKEAYETIQVAPQLNAISKMEDKPKIWVLYLEESIVEQSDLLVYMRDTVIDGDYMLYLIGNDDELEEAEKTLTHHAISGKFVRPLNVGDLANELNKAVEKEEEQETLKKILIVDDNPTMLRTMKNLLSGRYRVYMVGSGMNAITFLAKNQVDLILLDYEMPVTSGPQVLEMLRSEPETSSIPVMFLTAKGDKESVMKVVALKPEKYLLKTMPPQEWINSIDEFFAKQKSIRG